MDLQEPENARIIEDAIVSAAEGRYDLFAWCVMANHVHVLLTPIVNFDVITRKLKDGTAFEINGRQRERGRVFGQDESHDYCTRDQCAMTHIITAV